MTLYQAYIYNFCIKFNLIIENLIKLLLIYFRILNSYLDLDNNSDDLNEN